MHFIDFSPPTSPSPSHQRDALQKGLGRAWIWASSDVLAEDLLLEACLQDMRFDQQCEDSRSNWLWKIVQRMGAVERFQAPIFQALNQLSDERSANQLCEIAYHYAEIGDQLFRSRLYEIVESKPIVDSPWLGEDQIIFFAIEQLATRATGRVISLFTKNFKSGDEDRILESMSLPDDTCELHGLLMDVIKVLESNPNADCSRLGLIAYGSTPCQFCRFDAARLLYKQNVAPQWLIDECRFDADDRCKQIVYP